MSVPEGDLTGSHLGGTFLDEALARIKPAFRFAMAIDPFIIANRIDQCAFKRLKLIVSLLEELVAARRCAGFDVTHVQGKSRLHRVDGGNQAVELGIVAR